MVKEKLQSFTLDLKGIREDELLSADKNLRGFLIEGFNPILSRVEGLYNEQVGREYGAPYIKKGTEEVAEMITDFLSKIGETEKLAQTDTDKIIGAGNSDIASHLAFTLQTIKQGKTIDDVMHGHSDMDGKKCSGLIERFNEQFYEKDFKRSNIIVIDQNGRTLTRNLSKDIYDALDQSGTESSPQVVRDKLKEVTNISDEQLRLLISRMNQRSIESSGLAFVSSDSSATDISGMQGDVRGMQGARENIMYVTTDGDKITSVDGLESKSTLMRYTRAGELLEDYTTSYKLDASNLVGRAPFRRGGDDFVALPTQQLASEKITFTAMHEDAAYSLPEALRRRATDVVVQPPSTRRSSISIDLEVAQDVEKEATSSSPQSVTRVFESISPAVKGAFSRLRAMSGFAPVVDTGNGSPIRPVSPSVGTKSSKGNSLIE